VAKGGGSGIDKASNEPGCKVSGERTKGSSLGGDLILNEEARVQPKREKVQREVGEHQQVFQEGEGKQQAETGRFKNVPLLPPAGRAVQGEGEGGGRGGGGEAGKHGGTADGAAGAAMATSGGNDEG